MASGELLGAAVAELLETRTLYHVAWESGDITPLSVGEYHRPQWCRTGDAFLRRKQAEAAQIRIITKKARTC